MHESWGSNGQAVGSAKTVEEACEWCMRAVHESGTSGSDGAREVHEITQWCTRLRSGTRVRVVHDGAREVHEITWQACPEWDEVSSELACRTSFTVHLDSTFLGVHLNSTSLGVHLDGMYLSSGLDLAKLELRSSWWTRARRYRNSSGRLGMGNPGAVEKFLVHLQDLQEKILSYGLSRAAGGGAGRSWGAGEVLERSVVKVEAGR